MTAPTRFPNGVTNVGETNIFSLMKMSDPTQYHTYFNDFHVYTAGDWVVTETQAGATQALTAGDGGQLLLTNTSTENDWCLLQKTPAMFAITAGKKTFFKIRFQANSATECDWIAGLAIVDTTPLDATDGIFFSKDDGDTNIDFTCRKNATTGAANATAIGTFAADTWTELAWAYDGVSKVYYAINGVVLGSVSATSDYLPDATNLTVTFGIQAGTTAADTMTIDYVFAAEER